MYLFFSLVSGGKNFKTLFFLKDDNNHKIGRTCFFFFFSLLLISTILVLYVIRWPNLNYPVCISFSRERVFFMDLLRYGFARY